jgi:hypothetical protein
MACFVAIFESVQAISSRDTCMSGKTAIEPGRPRVRQFPAVSHKEKISHEAHEALSPDRRSGRRLRHVTCDDLCTGIHQYHLRPARGSVSYSAPSPGSAARPSGPTAVATRCPGCWTDLPARGRSGCCCPAEALHRGGNEPATTGREGQPPQSVLILPPFAIIPSSGSPTLTPHPPCAAAP